MLVAATSESRDVSLKQLKQEIKQILATKPSLPLTSFSLEYKRVIGRPFEAYRYGYNSPLDCLNHLSDTVNLERPDSLGDWVISLLGSAPSRPAGTDATIPGLGNVSA